VRLRSGAASQSERLVGRCSWSSTSIAVELQRIKLKLERIVAVSTQAHPPRIINLAQNQILKCLHAAATRSDQNQTARRSICS
jgi:hypothetical protein